MDHSQIKHKMTSPLPPEFKNLGAVYRIINEKNGKSYIGSSLNSRERLHDHYCKLKNGKHFNNGLQSDFNLYGKESFRVEILSGFHDRLSNTIYSIESALIKSLNPEYNKILYAA